MGAEGCGGAKGGWACIGLELNYSRKQTALLPVDAAVCKADV